MNNDTARREEQWGRLRERLLDGKPIAIPEFDDLSFPAPAWPRKIWYFHVDDEGLHIMPVYRGQFGCRKWVVATLGL